MIKHNNVSGRENVVAIAYARTLSDTRDNLALSIKWTLQRSNATQ